MDSDQEAYLIRKIKKFFKANDFDKKQVTKLFKKKQKLKVRCFNCDEENHIKENCPKLKKKTKEKDPTKFKHKNL